MFVPAYCATVYKYQGAAIQEEYNMYDVHLMDKKQLYTALSRCTDIAQLLPRYTTRMQPTLELTGVHGSAQQNGKIYEVTFEASDRVIHRLHLRGVLHGSNGTYQLSISSTRLQSHLKNKKSQVYAHWHEGPQISLVCNVPGQEVARGRWGTAHRALRQSVRLEAPQQTLQHRNQKVKASKGAPKKGDHGNRKAAKGAPRCGGQAS